MFKLFKRVCKKMGDTLVELANIKKELALEIIREVKNVNGDTLITLGIGSIAIPIFLITAGIFKNKRGGQNV